MPDSLLQIANSTGAAIMSGIKGTPFFSDVSQAVRFTIFIIILIGGSAIAWYEVRTTAVNAGEASKTNRVRIEALKGAVTDLRIGQVKLETTVEAEGRATRKDLARQEKTLDRILESLNSITPAAGGPQR